MSSTDDEENMYESQGNLFEGNTDYDTLKLSDHCTEKMKFSGGRDCGFGHIY